MLNQKHPLLEEGVVDLTWNRTPLYLVILIFRSYPSYQEKKTASHNILLKLRLFFSYLFFTVNHHVEKKRVEVFKLNAKEETIKDYLDYLDYLDLLFSKQYPTM